MKLSQITDLPVFFNLVRGARLPIKTTYKLAKLAEIVDKEIPFYRDQLQNIINEYADKDEEGHVIPTDDGQGIKIVSEKEEECMKKISELRDIDVDMKGISFTLDDFASLELALDELEAILPLINE